MSTDLDDIIRRDDELYQFDEAKEQAKATGRGTLASRLDALAKVAPAEPEVDQHDPETGEIGESEAMPSADLGTREDRSNNATTPSQPEVSAAAGGTTNPATVAKPPKTPEEYAAAVKSYIAAADDADWLETRWREERKLRERLGLPVDDAKVLGNAILTKAKELRASAHPSGATP